MKIKLPILFGKKQSNVVNDANKIVNQYIDRLNALKSKKRKPGGK